MVKLFHSNYIFMAGAFESLEKDISKAKRNFLIIAFLAIVIILFGAVSYGYLRFVEYSPYNLMGENKIFIVRPGENVHQISGNLEYEKLIKKSVYFEMYIWEKGIGDKLQAGEYMLSAKLSPAEIADLITNGKIYSQEINITIPEGFTLKQIDERAVLNNLIKKGEIENFDINNQKITAYEFLESARLAGAKNLEGFLFPDTYKFKKDVKINDIILKILNNFSLKLNGDLRKEIANRNKSVFEIIIMASILEKEVKTFDDMKVVSGILWKRIELGMPLQVDASIIYALGDGKPALTYEDLKLNSIYNTYKYKGLPPGPISNPGFNAIKAAVYPQESDYLYYLSASESGKTIFAKTLAEHNANKKKYLTN